MYYIFSIQEDGDDGVLSSELISQAKQSRSEKKARKALCKLGKPLLCDPLDSFNLAPEVQYLANIQLIDPPPNLPTPLRKAVSESTCS